MKNESDPSPIISQFEKLLADLANADVDFCLVGGLAVILSGYVRVTEDADILVSERTENVSRLLSALAQWGEGWARELKLDDFAPQEGSIRISEDFDLDIFVRMQGHSIEHFRPRLRYFESRGARIPYLAPEDIIALKSDSWRDKDKLDVAAMQEVLRREGRHWP